MNDETESTHLLDDNDKPLEEPLQQAERLVTDQFEGGHLTPDLTRVFLGISNHLEATDHTSLAGTSQKLAALAWSLHNNDQELNDSLFELFEEGLAGLRDSLQQAGFEVSDGPTTNRSAMEDKLDLFVGDEELESLNQAELDAIDVDLPGGTNNPAEPEDEPDEEQQPAEASDGDDHLFEPWDPSGMEGLIEDYLAEAREGLEQLTNSLIELEENPSAEKIDDIFRVAHTLKGSSGMVGLEVLEELAHTMEELLDDVRDGKRDVTPELIDLLLICNDKIEAILDRVARKETIQVRVRHLLEGLEAFRDGEPVDVDAIRREEQETTEESSDQDDDDNEKDEESVTETIRVGIPKLDRVINLVGELTINKQQLDQSLNEIQQLERELSRLVDEADDLLNRADVDSNLDDELRLVHGALRDMNLETDQASSDISRVTSDLQDAVMKTRMVPVNQLFQKFPRQVRDLARAKDKEVDFETKGGDTELDKTVIEKIGDPLMHIIRNAIDHGLETPEERRQSGKPETGKLTIEAGYEGDLVVIEIRDDGQGIAPEPLIEKALENNVITEQEVETLSDEEAQELIFEPGLSTTEEVTETSGRGVGMDVVRSNITDLNGQVELDSTIGEGTTFTIKLPLTMAIVQVLQVQCGRQRLALPLSSIRETLRVHNDRIEQLGDQEVFELRGTTIPLLRLSDVLRLPTEHQVHQDIYPVVIAEWGDRQVGVMVDKLVDKQEVVIKDLGTMLTDVPYNSGATIHGDGSVVLIVDLGRIVQDAEEFQSEGARPAQTSPGETSRGTVLIADDSETVRSMLTDILTEHGYEVMEASDGRQALERLEEEPDVDLVTTDINMPHRDGYELVEGLRQLEEHRHTPVIMISSRDAKVDKMRGFEVGADDYLEKPFNSEDVLTTVDELVDGPTAGERAS